MFESLIGPIREEIDVTRIVADIAEIFSRDRWFTFPKFQETAQYAQKRLRANGAKDVQIVQLPADGKTLFGSWRGGLAWDATGATLTVLEPQPMAGRVLADYRAVPCSLIMWSGPTPAGGADAEIVDVGTGQKPEDYAGKDLRGRIALVNSHALACKGLAVRHGAIGIISDYNPQPQKNIDAVFWNNAFADYSGGWPLTSDCTRIFGFDIPPRVGQELRDLLAAGQKVRVHAEVDTRLYEGEFPVITGLVPGTTGEEVLALGHAFEQGAKDNASGVACIMEAQRALAALIENGKLPRPRRGIRVLVTNECFGTIGYVDRFPERTGKTVAAICLDETGIDTRTSPEVQSICFNPASSASYIDALIGQLAETLWKGELFNPYVLRPYGASDNLIAHSSIGIPAVWMGCHGSRVTWHTSIDTPERMAPGQLRAAAAYTAVYLYFLANAGPREAVWLAALAAGRAREQMQRAQVTALGPVLSGAEARGKAAESLGRRLAYLLIVHERAVGSVLRLSGAKAVKAAVAKGVKELRAFAADLEASLGARRGGGKGKGMASPFGTKMPAEAWKVRPVAAVSGPITYDPVPADQREGRKDPRWGGAVNVALGWADGKRTLAETVALAEHETGRAQAGVAEEMLWLIGHGVIGDAGGLSTKSPSTKTGRTTKKMN